MSWTVAALRLTLSAVPAVPVTQSNSFLKTITNMTAAEHEQLQLRAQRRCFLCKQVGHMSVACLNSKEAPALSSVQIQEFNTTEVSKTA